MKLLEQIKDTAPTSQRSIIEYVLSNPQKALKQNVTELAHSVGTSSSAVVRLCKLLNIKGFAEFKLLLSREVFGNLDKSNNDLLEQVEGLDLPLDQLISYFIKFTNCALNQLELILNSTEVEKAVELLTSRNDILILGIGASSIVALDLLYKLSRLGMNAKFVQDSDLQIVQACATDSSSLVFAISYSGETKSVIKAVKSAKDNDAKVITLTSIKNNKLAKLSDVKLQVPASENEYRHGATLSRLNQLVVIDIIYSILISQMSDKEREIMRTSHESVSGKYKIK